MEIKYKGIIHERMEDAPFVGALIIAPSCSMGCKGCCNEHLKTKEYKVATAEDIIDEVLQNPFNEGIILAGLEWSEHSQEMIELCRVASEKELKVMIYTGLELKDFHYRIGYQCANRFKFRDFPKQFPKRELFCYLGSGLLDAVIPETYWVKTGGFKLSNPSPDNVQFGVRLASDNQKIIEIRKADEEVIKDDESKTHRQKCNTTKEG